MIREIDRTNLDSIRNPAMRTYILRYLDIYDDFLAQVRQSGIEIDPADDRQQAAEKMEALRLKGARLRNDTKSIYINHISDACLACQTGVGSATYFISLKCHRDCFYCFNPNQENYEFHLDHLRPVLDELDDVHRRNQKVKHLALTGGEPLLHKEQALAFFKQARLYFPDAYMRLYTCGDHIDEQTLQALKESRLDEIRFSIRIHDLEKGTRHTLERIALAKAYIPQVMVEMPVLPDTLEEMKALLVELDRLEIFSINLLEFCYPMNNAEIFRSKGYRVKSHPFRVLYDYWYAGGLPVAGSELACLDLLDFAIDSSLRLGVHYCSLENKHTGQIYQQNTSSPLPRIKVFSRKDFFLKSAKVFGEDVAPVQRFFDKQGFDRYEINEEYNYLEFHVSQIRALKKLAVQVGLCTSVFEKRGADTYLREIKVDLAEPDSFMLSKDI
jgi:pyruvate formate-lyase activating enzyme-like uncharacterized protein